MTVISESRAAADLVASAEELEAAQRLDEAKEAFDSALSADPSSKSAAEGRARIAIQLREANGAEHCARALAFHDDDPELQLQMIATAATELGSGAISLVESYIKRHQEDARAHELLADLRAQAGEGEAFADSYVAALSANPGNKQLLLSYWNMLSRSGRHMQALESIERNRSLFEKDRDFDILEVAISGHAGEIDRAAKILERMDDRLDAQMARGLNHLQSGRPQDAAQILEHVTAREPDNFEAWALLELAWRVTQDPRHEWLVGQPGLFGASQLDLDSGRLDIIATALRGLHRANAHPIGQSLRGGTQTSGQLFIRSEPEITMLIEALATAIQAFVGNLPPADPKHPLLKHRDSAMAFGPSWSVRFTDSGFHAAHFHPGGILSSACYIATPEAVTDQQTQAGWLEIGRPPPELKMDVPPIATFEPKPGRLVLFPSFLFHGTRPFAGGERLTVAFDLVPVTVVG